MFAPPIIAGEFATSITAANVAAHTEYVCGPLTVYPARYIAELDGNRLELSATEFAALVALIRKPGDVVRLADLHQATHGSDTDKIEMGNQVRPVISALRRKLPAGLIENVRGVGYRLAYD